MEFVALSGLQNGHSTEIIFDNPDNWDVCLSSRIGHACKLDIDQVPEFPRATGIACTLGLFFI